MKRLVITLSLVVSLIFILSFGAFAVGENAEGEAGVLKELGLFLGTDKGFELERTMNRAEAAVMLVRYMGAEKEALAGTWKHPFTDVPAWADKYIGWLYVNKLTNGIGGNRYGAANPVTFEQYCVFLSRAATGKDEISYTLARQEELDEYAKKPFLRRYAVSLSERAFKTTYTKNESSTYMSRFLVERGVFTAEQLKTAAWGILSPDYSWADGTEQGRAIECSIAGVVVARSAEAGYEVINKYPDEFSDYMFAIRRADGILYLCRMDSKTLESEVIDRMPEQEKAFYSFMHLMTSDGRNYFLKRGVNTNLYSLIAYDGAMISTVAEGLAFRNVIPYGDIHMIDNGVLLMETTQTDKTVFYRIKGNTVTAKNAEFDTTILDFKNGFIVTQTTTPLVTKICCYDSEFNLLRTYSANQDTEDARTITKFIKYRADGSYEDTGLYNGEAGLYQLTDKGLIQITARPALDVLTLEDGGHLILTHDPGKRVDGMVGPGGNQIMRIAADGSEELILGNDPPHSIPIAGFGGNGNPGIGLQSFGDDPDTVYFYTAKPLGMMHHDFYFYALKDGEITVLGFSAGRGEMLGTTTEEEVAAAEQARLDGLGF